MTAAVVLSLHPQPRQPRSIPRRRLVMCSGGKGTGVGGEVLPNRQLHQKRIRCVRRSIMQMRRESRIPPIHRSPHSRDYGGSYVLVASVMLPLIPNCREPGQVKKEAADWSDGHVTAPIVLAYG